MSGAKKSSGVCKPTLYSSYRPGVIFLGRAPQDTGLQKVSFCRIFCLGGRDSEWHQLHPVFSTGHLCNTAVQSGSAASHKRIIWIGGSGGVPGVRSVRGSHRSKEDPGLQRFALVTLLPYYHHHRRCLSGSTRVTNK